jgi:leucyl-tRNA synthetase
MQYDHRSIEAKWQESWKKDGVYQAIDHSDKPKFYALDMFPYPSGAGLHVGHPLGYIASDIYARYKKLKGYNVLHPMGFDSFGLPAEQYAIQTGLHPAITTQANIARYKEQLNKIGFAYDWNRETQTSDPLYYRWTQWIFLQLFGSWYNTDTDKAEPIETLMAHFEANGSAGAHAVCDDHPAFSAAEWQTFTEKQKSDVLLCYRLAYLSEGWVNWCPALGTVLANDEVKDGFSERGGHPVEQKRMKQWSMRISAYADRLLEGLERIDWSDALKEQQRNWIGRSRGAVVRFALTPSPSPKERGDSLAKFGYATWDERNLPNLMEFAKNNRKEYIEAEKVLWEAVRNRLGTKFRRQHPVGNYLPDFVCLEKRLIIEVDGDYHNDDQQMLLDREREKELIDLGYQLIRFTNEEVLSDIEAVCARIKQALSLGEGLGEGIEVFTTRPDTIFGVSFMVLAPEHELVAKITTDDRRTEVDEYVKQAGRRTERERMADVKRVSGCFTGAYAAHPFTGQPIPIWIGDYVLASYGTGAVMAVPAGDQRDWDFATHFGLPIPNIFDGADISKGAYDEKEIPLKDSGFLNGLKGEEAINCAITRIEEEEIGYGRVNFRLRDAVFGRQRYWGEPIPIYYINDIPHPLPEKELPLTLPEVDKYLPTEDGEPPLARAADWKYQGQYDYEHTTMPGWAGSSWYFLRYMDPGNPDAFADPEKMKYWNQVDLYIGGSEHATGHLLYSRFWTKFLCDLGWITFDEPFKKLINQGMILGRSSFIYREKGSNKLISAGLANENDTLALHVDVSLVENDELNLDAFRIHYPDYAEAEIVLENGKYICGTEVEKMSKSKFNVVTPDDLCEKFGADTLRCYEMFLGPLEQSKPWDTQGITGVSGFLKRLWRLFYGDDGLLVSNDEPTKSELRALHQCIKRVEEDLARYSFNTVVSQFMITVNELTDLKCHKRAVLEPLLILLSPYAPHIAEELWHAVGNTSYIADAVFPVFDPAMLVQDEIMYPIQFNGKKRFDMAVPNGLSPKEIEERVMSAEETQKYLEGKAPKKVIVVPGRIVNFVV